MFTGFLVGVLKGKKLLARNSITRWQKEEMELKEIRCDGGGWIKVA